MLYIVLSVVIVCSAFLAFQMLSFKLSEKK
jgi:hypothetical protein